MLNRNCKVGTGMTGLNPDITEEPQLIAWLKKHPQKKHFTKKKDKIPKFKR